MAVTEGMVGSPVYGEDGNQLGKVKEVRGRYFKVDARMQPDYWLRADSVQTSGDRLVVMGDAEPVQNPDFDETETRAGATSAATTQRETEMHAGTGSVSAAGHTTTDNESIQLREERLRVDREQEQAGTVHLGKRVVEEQETVNVPVREERVVIERQPVEGERTTGGEIRDTNETIDVPVTRERADVQKETVVAEEVNVRKESTERQEQVQATVRKEELDVQGDGTQVTGGNANAPHQGTHQHGQTRRS